VPAEELAETGAKIGAIRAALIGAPGRTGRDI
jgi:hypothetical protein